MHSDNTIVDIEDIGWIYYAWHVSIIIDNKDIDIEVCQKWSHIEFD